jgi:serine/threonine-protein kinase
MIGKYKIVSLVAKGGMGAVYKAVHPSLRRYVIIKKLTIPGERLDHRALQARGADPP